MNENSSTNENTLPQNQEQLTEVKNNSASQNQEPPKKKNKKGLIVGVVAALTVLGIGAYFFIDYKMNEKKVYVADDSEETEYAIKSPENNINSASYSKYLTISEYQNLPQNYQGAILHFLEENDHGTDGSYFVSRIPSRAKNIYSFGNFTGENNVDNNQDIAFIAEYFDYKTSRLVIMNANGDLLFTKEYSSLPIINSFKKGSKIYAGERKLTRSNYDGIILKEPNTKYVIIYDGKSKQFVEHYQYTESDLRESEYSGEDECTDCDTVDTSEYN